VLNLATGLCFVVQSSFKDVVQASSFCVFSLYFEQLALVVGAVRSIFLELRDQIGVAYPNTTHALTV
jgi:hypothetical protein